MIELKEIDGYRKEIQEQIKKISHKEDEICGVVVLTEKGVEVRQIKNTTDNAVVWYLMDKEELSKQTLDTNFLGGNGKNEFIGIFHTHPNHESNPSQADIKYMLGGKWYFIYSVVCDNLTAFIKMRYENGI